MKKMLFPVLLCLLASSAVQAQLLVQPGIVLPKDGRLVQDLNAFLNAADADNESNTHLLPAERAETFVQLDEVKHMRYSAADADSNFYKPCLMNVLPLSDKRYWIQVAYMGYRPDSVRLRASFDFIAHPSGDSFLFASPLKYNTRHWKTERAGNTVFYYKESLDRDQLQSYRKHTSAYDEKLKPGNKEVIVYCCAHAIELQRLAGVTYKADYNGRQSGAWSTYTGNRKLVLLGNDNEHFSHFDPHDLWHERLGLEIARSKTNRPVDEGCAYLYGGSWGMSWATIFKAFKEQVADKQDTDWTALKEQPVLFKTGAYDNSADYIVNALWVKKIESEKGFPGVWELLTCGPYQKGNEQYYRTLERLTGVSKAGYNAAVAELIRKESQSIKL